MLRSYRLGRRNFIGIGMAGGLSLLSNPGQVLAGTDQRRDRPGRAKNVLVILEQGGMSHMDTWDPLHLRNHFQQIEVHLYALQNVQECSHQR